MQKEVTLRDLNRVYVKELLASKRFWKGFILYICGMLAALSISLTGKYIALAGAILSFVGALIMMSANWNGHKKVMKRLRWVS